MEMVVPYELNYDLAYQLVLLRQTLFSSSVALKSSYYSRIKLSIGDILCAATSPVISFRR